jgi:hypothetical protein
VLPVPGSATVKTETSRGKEEAMARKTWFALGFGVGYVVGARAGRERYEQIRAWWTRISGSPAVQRATERTRVVAAAGARRGLSAVQAGVQRAGTALRSRLHRRGEVEAGIGV